MNSCSASIKWIILSLAIIGAVAVADDKDRNVKGPYVRGGVVGSDPCKGAKTVINLPFALTNIAVESIGNNKVRYNFHSTGETTEVHFLKDVTFCDHFRWNPLKPYQVVATKLSDAASFKSAVKGHLDAVGKDHVLYYTHGLAIDPSKSIKETKDLQNGAYEMISIHWRNHWGSGFLSYDYCRRAYAPRIGKHLAAAFEAFNGVDYYQSMMSHSMGNYVFRVFAQNIENNGFTIPEEPVFKNWFSVAADARMDMFSSEYNPAVSGLDELESPEDLEEDLDMPEDELVANGGYTISRVAANSHVLYDRWDGALSIRETFQAGWGEGIRKALGKYGRQAEMDMDEYFDDKVKFHNFDQFGPLHNYQLRPDVKDVYVEWATKDIPSAMNQKNSNASDKVEVKYY